MIRTINDPKQIRKLYKKLTEQLLPLFSEQMTCTIGYHGGSFTETVHYARELDLWYATWEEKEVIKNLFGTGRPNEHTSNSMTGQVNIPTKKINRSIAGTFAQTEDQEILLLHRGNIGGGKENVGKQSFLENYRGDVEEVEEQGAGTRFCVVGVVDSPFFPEQLKNFIAEIGRVKALLSGTPGFNIDQFRFNDEKGGKYKLGELKRDRTANRTHFLVVNHLADVLRKQGLLVGNDPNRDIYIHDNQRIKALFEIKSSLTTQNLYTAVGQLLVYSIPIRNKVKLVLVLPDKLEAEVAKKLKSLGIELLYFKWNDETQPVFSANRIAKVVSGL
jgi:hypothetical protein